MSYEAGEAERADCKARGGGVMDCAAHMVEWRLRRKWIGGLVSAGSLLLVAFIEHRRWMRWS